MLSKNVKDTEKIAKIFLDRILKRKTKRPGALIIGLSGDLGAGKTAFVQAAAKHLGVKSKINSPTFVIIKKYSLKKLSGYKFLFHIDAYRLRNEKELSNLGWEEIANKKEHLIFIEWPENIAKAMPLFSRYIHIFSDENRQRHFKLK